MIGIPPTATRCALRIWFIVIIFEAMNSELRPYLNSEAVSPFELSNAVMVPWATRGYVMRATSMPISDH